LAGVRFIVKVELIRISKKRQKTTMVRRAFVFLGLRLEGERDENGQRKNPGQGQQASMAAGAVFW
jgi:hypothetical protein